MCPCTCSLGGLMRYACLSTGVWQLPRMAADRLWGLALVQKNALGAACGTNAPDHDVCRPLVALPSEPGFKLQSRYAFEKKVCAELIQQLPKTAFFLQNFRPEVDNWLSFFWESFRQSTRYTYIFDQTTNLEAITAGMKNTLRSDLKKAAKLLEYQQENDAWVAHGDCHSTQSQLCYLRFVF